MPTSSYRPALLPRQRNRFCAGSGPFVPRRRKGRRLFVELLEDRTLLAASITGNVFNDLNGNGQPAGDPPATGATVYVDLNGNGQLDAQETFAGSTTFQQITGGAAAGYFAAPDAVSGVAATFSDVAVSLNLARTGPGGPENLDVVLLSPQGQIDFTGPDLIHLQPGQSFNGTFNDHAAPLPAPRSHYAGTFQPFQPFTTPHLDILPYPAGATGPDGTWRLLILDNDTGNPVEPLGITLTSWSIAFTNPEPSTTTDANGNYSFSNLAADTYTVGVAGTAAAHDPTRRVAVTAGPPPAVANFGITPALGSVSGKVVNDLNGNGEPPVAGATVYLDMNGNGRYDPPLSFAGSPIQDLGGFAGATAAVSGLSAQFTHISVSVDLARAAGSGSQWDVFLASPQGFNDSNAPELFPLPADTSFNVTLDDNASTVITSAPPPFVGTFQPATSFAGNEIYGTADPNGTWYLLFLDPNNGFNPVPTATGVTLLSWSIRFIQEPGTTTDANGDYTFPGLQHGTYKVAVADTAASADPTQTVTLNAGQPSGTADFAVRPVVGTVVNGSGQPVAGATTYLDLNGNGRYDPPLTFAGSTAIGDVGGLDGATLSVNGLSAQFTHVSVNLDVARAAGGGSPWDVFLASPQGFNAGSGPELVPLPTGITYNVTLDDNAATPILSAPPPFAGTFQPVQAFGAPGNDVYGTNNPNGTWYLLFLDPSGNPVPVSGVTLLSWSLSFIQEPSTTTDADGTYSFTGLKAGNYTVGVAAPFVGPDPQKTASVPNGHTKAGVNFTIAPAPDLVATSFQVAGGFATWGQQVTVNYTIVNRGLGDAAAFDVDLHLSPTAQVSGSDTPFKSFTVNALAAGASTSDPLTFTLPANPPAGFTATGPIYLSLVVDPGDKAESNTADKSNRGLGIDTALVSNAALTSGADARQQPTVVVDPNNPNHVVVATMDFNLPNNYASIGVQTSTDGGRSWTATSVPLPAGFSGAAGYPSVAFDGQGRVYVAFMAATFSPGLMPPSIFADGRDNNGQLFRGYGTQANNGIFLSVSGDGGLTWNAPIPVVEHTYTPGTPVPFEALPDLAIDTSALLPNGGPNPNYGRLYLTWTREYPAGLMPGVTSPSGGSDILFASSPDGGITWITPGQSAFNRTLSETFAPGNPFTITFTNKATGTLLVNVTPGANLTGGALTVQLFAPDGVTLLATATTVGPRVASVAAPAALNQKIIIKVSGTTATTAGNYTVQVVSTSTLPALRDTEYPADGSGQVGGGSDILSHLTVGPDGQVTVALFRGGLFRVFGSTDGGTVFQTLGDPFGDNFTTLAPNPLAGEDFRNFPVRQVVADPTRPGTLYALEVVAISTANPADGSCVVFARSTDDGKTWTNVFQVGPNANSTSLDDDNGGQPLNLSASLLNQVVTGQAMPTMAVDNDGNLSVIWYDTRRDPAGHALDVFGVVSSDGGQTFSSNYRVSDASFDPSAGQFLEGNSTYDFGDGIGLAAVNGIDLAAWTDTRDGKQDVFFADYPLLPSAPAAPDDRFEPNDLRQTATNLGVVSVQRVFPRLALTAGDDDWYSIQAAATGFLSVVVTGTGTPAPTTVELYDSSGSATPLATATAVSSDEQLLDFPGTSGQTYFIHVTGLPAGASTVSYSLSVQSLTADLGTLVHKTVPSVNPLAPGNQAVYRAVAAVAGSMEVTLTTQNGTGSLVLQSLGAGGQTGQAAGPGAQSVSVAVSAGQVVVAVVGSTESDGGYALEFSNLDQFETAQNTTLFFPTSGGTPSALGVADLNGDDHPDLVTANPDITDSQNNIVNSDSVNVLLNNGDGTFGASRGYDAGPGPTGSLAGPVDLVVGPLTGPGTTDVAVSNYQAGNVSVLLGNADGTLQPPRISNSTALPAAMASGNLNGDATPDLAVLELHPGADGVSDVAVLFGRGDGTYLPPIFLPTTFTSGAGQVLVGDFTGHGKGSGLQDVVALGFNQSDVDLFVNQGNGKFTLHVLHAPENVASALAADLNGDGKTDLVLGGTNTGNVYVLLGNGDGTFQPAQTYFANTDPARTAASVSGLALATITRAGQPNPPADLVVTVLPRVGNGSPQVVLLPTKGDGTFGAARQLAVGPFTGPIVAGNLANNGVDDVAAAVPGGVEVIYGKGPPISANTTRNLGTVVHWLSETLAIVPGHTDARFTMTVPKEAVPGAGPEVIDFSALFQYLDGSGLGFEVIGPDGTQSGTRFEVVANAGDVLTLHVFGLPGGGYGAYTLDIDLRPQAVSVAAPSLLPGTSGPVSSLVITFQGDRLDPTTAQDPRNYTLFHLSPDGQTAEKFTPATINDALPVVYDPGANIDVATGLTYPTAVRQTVTLFFPGALPAGSYLLVLSRSIQSAAYSDAESGRLADVAGFGGHTVVSTGNPGVENGAVLYLNDLVPVASGSADFTAFSAGTGFLTDFHDELGAMLDGQVTSLGDDPGITPALLDQSQQIFTSGTGAGGSGPSFLVLFIDPAGLSLVDPQSKRTTFDLQTNQVTNTQPKTYTEVGGNIEVVVVADVAGIFRLSLSDVVATARGGALVIGPDGVQQFSLTDQMRAGVQDFTFDVPASLTVAALGSEAAAAAGSATPTGTFNLAGLATEIVQAVTTGPATVEITQAPVNETGGNVTAGGESGGATTTAAASGTGLSGGGGSGAAGQTLWDAFKDNLEPLQKVLADLGKRAAKQSSVVGKGWDVLQTLGVPALVVPLQRVGGQVFKAVLRGLGAGLLGPAVQPAPGDGAVLPPTGDGPEVTPVGQAPALPPVETSGKGGVLWLAAALAGGLVPVWREASRRRRRDDRRRPSV